MFDNLYLKVFNFYKPRLKQKAGNLAVIYISLVQIAIFILLMEFFLVFSKQMNFAGLSTSKVIFIIIFGCFGIYFKNWMTYTGRKRNVLKSKLKNKNDQSIVVLWLIPIALMFLCVMFWIKLM
jgi:hypothetical protein